MLKVIFLVFLTALGSAHADAPVEMGESNLRRLEKDLHLLQQFVYKRFGGDPAFHDSAINPPVDSSQTMFLEKLNDLNKRFSELMNKVEELSHKIDLQEKALQEKAKEIDQKTGSMAQILHEMRQNLKKEQDMSYEKRIAALEAEGLVSLVDSPDLSDEQQEKALRLFLNKFQDHPSLLEMHKRLVQILHKNQNYKEAALYAGEFYKKDPTHKDAPEMLLLLAFSLHRLGKTQEACTTLQKIKTDYGDKDPAFLEKVQQAVTFCACPTS